MVPFSSRQCGVQARATSFTAIFVFVGLKAIISRQELPSLTLLDHFAVASHSRVSVASNVVFSAGRFESYRTGYLLWDSV